MDVFPPNDGRHRISYAHAVRLCAEEEPPMVDYREAIEKAAGQLDIKVTGVENFKVTALETDLGEFRRCGDWIFMHAEEEEKDIRLDIKSWKTLAEEIPKVLAVFGV